MKPPPVPDDESQRVRLLHELRLLDTPAEESFDAATRLASRLTGCPIAGLVLIDSHRQWFKSLLGADVRETPRDIAFCAHTVSSGEPLVVTDLTLDDRFAANPFVTGDPGVRFYAAVPLCVEGHHIGTVCVMDLQPRTLGSTEQGALADVAHMVSDILHARLKEQRWRLQEARVRTASRAGSDWLWETDAGGHITWVSATMEAHTGIPAAAEIGRTAADVLVPSQDPELRASFEAYLRAREARQPFHNMVAERDSPLGRLTVSISGVPVFDSAGQFRGYRGATRIITEELRSQQRARKAQQLLQNAIESVGALIVITDAQDGVVHANRSWRESVSQYLDPQSPNWAAALRAMVHAGEFPDAIGREEEFIAWRLSHPAPGEGAREVRRGNTWLLVTEQALDDGGRIHVGVDITERKQAELELARREAQLRASDARTAAVLQALPDAWYVLDQYGRYIESSLDERLARQQAFKRVGHALEDVLPPKAATIHREALRRALDEGTLQRVEYELEREDGDIRWCEARLVRMSGGQVLLLERDLTDLRSMERELQIMHRAIEAEASLPITVADALAPGQPLVYVNPAFERLTGYQRHEVLGRNCRFLQGDDNAQAGLQTLRAAMAEGVSCTVVLNNYRKDGARFINELHVAPVRDGQGRITHYIGVQTDITDRSLAADRLRLSEELYRSVALAISDGLMVVTSGGYVVAANPAACRILESTMEELVMAPGLNLLTEALQPLPAELHPVNMALGGGEPVAERVFGLRGVDGQPRWLGVSAQPLRVEPNERALSAVVTFRDITRQRLAEQALALSEQRWKFALEGSGDGVWDWDAQNGRVYFSRRWKQILGHGESELGDQPVEWSSRIHPDDVHAVKARIVAHLRDQTPVYHSEHRMRHKDGHYIWVIERGKVVQRDARGRALRLVGTYSDITPQKEAEVVLRDKQAAELASRSKTEFLSRMSHEMRTPLNALIGFSQLLKVGAARSDPTQVRDYATHMLQAGQHLLALINDVLDLQRVEAGQLSIQIAPCGLREIVLQAIELLSPVAQGADVWFDNDIEHDVLIMADAQRLRQVLLNIIANAIKYNRRGGRVRLSTLPIRDQRVGIQIRDTGDGLTPEQLAKLFQPFERLGRETSTIEGTGLGLVIAKRLVEEMDGAITVSSVPGHGTCVTLHVPTADACLLPEQASTSPGALALPRRPGQVRMLYVEDNRINALLFEEAMKLTGHIELMVAEDGEQAFSIVRDWRPDVLVLDAHLPGMNGIEILDRLRKLHGLHEVPAFMCSADAMPEDIQRALDAGFLGYWTKPIEVAKVLADVEKVAPRPVGVA